ncbi:hypothetical protein [Tuberibacillus sp. Marseille-P3662]|uniref:hypothetical protein n=1 Tax=Tuberibacillus sp. Marseille-P3662 TaxID=1965358 RepID=UPI000A1C814F|nr:hypothetical protein [Tuberibacillus sp. Marseille-P3662]
MSQKKKLDKAFTQGFIRGCEETWKLTEEAMNNIDGIGPKTQEKIHTAILERTKEEMRKGVGR